MEYLKAREIVMALLLMIGLGNLTSPIFVMMLVLVGLYYVYDYRSINHRLTQLFQSASRSKEVPFVSTMESRKYVTERSNDTEIQPLLRRLRKYRRYNKVSYDKGEKFIDQYLLLERQILKDVSRSHHLYENATVAYKEALKEFGGLILACPSHGVRARTLSETYEKKIPRTHEEKIGALCAELRNICYDRLYNLGHRLNEDWLRHPTTYKSEIMLHEVEPSNGADQRFREN